MTCDLEALVVECQASLDDRAMEALYVRGMSDQQIERYRVGYSSEPLGLKGISEVADCHVFPLTNALGQVKGLQVRPVLRANKAYKDYFAPGSEAEPVLFGLSQAMESAWELGYCWLVEGVFDLSAIQKGCRPVVATLKAGTTPALARLLRRMGLLVYMGWDKDSTGQTARQKFVQYYGRTIPYRDVAYPFVTTPSGKPAKDPGDLWETWGSKKIAEFVAEQLRS